VGSAHVHRTFSFSSCGLAKASGAMYAGVPLSPVRVKNVRNGCRFLLIPKSATCGIVMRLNYFEHSSLLLLACRTPFGASPRPFLPTRMFSQQHVNPLHRCSRLISAR